MKKPTYSDTLRVIIGGEPKTTLEKVAVELATECDELVGTIAREAKLVVGAYQHTIEVVNDLNSTYNPVCRMDSVGRVVAKSEELVARRETLQRVLTAMSEKHGPCMWHRFCNVWIQKQHE